MKRNTIGDASQVRPGDDERPAVSPGGPGRSSPIDLVHHQLAGSGIPEPVTIRPLPPAPAPRARPPACPRSSVVAQGALRCLYDQAGTDMAMRPGGGVRLE